MGGGKNKFGGSNTSDKGLLSNIMHGLAGYPPGGHGGYPPPHGYPPAPYPYPSYGYPPQGYPPHASYTRPYGSSAPLYHEHGHGHGSTIGSMLAGGAAAYGAHHLFSHGRHHHHFPGHGMYHGHHGKFKHGKFWKHGKFGGKFKKWK